MQLGNRLRAAEHGADSVLHLGFFGVGQRLAAKIDPKRVNSDSDGGVAGEHLGGVQVDVEGVEHAEDFREQAGLLLVVGDDGQLGEIAAGFVAKVDAGQHGGAEAVDHRHVQIHFVERGVEQILRRHAGGVLVDGVGREVLLGELALHALAVLGEIGHERGGAARRRRYLAPLPTRPLGRARRPLGRTARSEKRFCISVQTPLPTECVSAYVSR